MKKTLLFVALMCGLISHAQLPVACRTNPPVMEDMFIQDYSTHQRFPNIMITNPGCGGDNFPLLSIRQTDGEVFQMGTLPSYLAAYVPTNRSITINGVTQDLSVNRSFTVTATSTRTINNNVARSLNSNYTISSARDSQVSYSVSLSVTNPLLAGSSIASAFLEYSTDGGTNWITVAQAVNQSSVGVSVTVAITLPNTQVISGVVPANALTRIRSTTSGTASVTYTRGQEVLL